ncbi:MAG: hypothetical protein KC441_15675, partial [Anaerolineales bacterium]|nr:hypothetical protein [Anaerolineales bacterium]
EEEGMALNPEPAQMMQKIVPFSPDLVGELVTFEFITPDEPGTYHFRCHLLYEQMVLQSYLMQIEVAAQPAPRPEPQLTAVLDYVLQRRWSQETLNRLGETRFNLLISGEGTYWQLQGEAGAKGAAAISEGEWQQFTLLLRQALRRAAWGDDGPFRPGHHYRYERRPDMRQLGQDLARLAVAGYRVFDALFSRSSPTDPYAAEKIIDGLQTPGVIQTAVTDSSAVMPPLALLYDYPLDTGIPIDKFSLCPEFESAWHSGDPLHDSACFQGRCPSRGRTQVVCPSGFWGFRHVIAGPLSVGEAADAPASIGVAQQPRLALHLSTDPNFVGREAHAARLQGMMKGVEGRVKTAVTRAESLDLLAQNEAQVVYFYCHGGVVDGRPYLQVGPREEKGMTRGNLRQARVRWSRTRPLVFLNTVNTTSLTPESGRALLSGFVQIAQAAGLVAADITLLEPLAARFADEFLRLFLVEQYPAGEALRRARLRLLQEGNPLGLIYTLYALPGLRLEPDMLADFGQTAVEEPSPAEQIYQSAEPEPATPQPDGRFLADVTMPDDVRLNQGTAFTKTWRVQNSGNVPWGEGFQLVHTDGDLLAAEPSQLLPFTPPGETAEISLSMTAPREPGTFYSDWRFQDDHGTLFGDTIFVRAIVEDLSHPQPADGRFLADVTMPDDAEVQPGYRFTKTWQVRNTGRRVWGPDFKLKFVGGLPMTDVLEHPLPLTVPGDEVTISVPMIAPTTSGTHTGDWRLVDERERPFGEVLYVRIGVPGRAAEREAVDDVAYRAPSGSIVRPISQRDPRWADMRLGYSGPTMSQRGSLLACYAMLARAFGHAFTPPELNEQLMRHSAFLEGAVLRPEALADVFDDMVFVGQVAAQRDLTARIDASLQAGRPVVALVDFTRDTPYTDADEHFVLIVAQDGRDYRINDPWLWPAQEASLLERYGWAERPLSETIRSAIFYRKDDKPRRKYAAA